MSAGGRASRRRVMLPAQGPTSATRNPSSSPRTLAPSVLPSAGPSQQTPAMAPDLNSVPPSPRLSQPAAAATQAPAPAPSNPNSSHHSSSATASHPSSRRASQLSPMNPPPLPLGAAATNGAAPTSQPQQTTIQPFPPLSPHLPGTAPRGSLDESGVPMRHPRPLTAAELHHELELEQEAVVSTAMPPPLPQACSSRNPAQIPQCVPMTNLPLRTGQPPYPRAQRTPRALRLRRQLRVVHQHLGAPEHFPLRSNRPLDRPRRRPDRPNTPHGLAPPPQLQQRQPRLPAAPLVHVEPEPGPGPAPTTADRRRGKWRDQRQQQHLRGRRGHGEEPEPWCGDERRGEVRGGGAAQTGA